MQCRGIFLNLLGGIQHIPVIHADQVSWAVLYLQDRLWIIHEAMCSLKQYKQYRGRAIPNLPAL